MKIEFLFYHDCPSHGTALQRLRDVLSEEGIKERVQIIEVKTMEQAQQLRFVGSPTIRVNGCDIAPLAEDAVYGLSCRAYFREDGRITPLPPTELIRRAVAVKN